MAAVSRSEHMLGTSTRNAVQRNVTQRSGMGGMGDTIAHTVQCKQRRSVVVVVVVVVLLVEGRCNAIICVARASSRVQRHNVQTMLPTIEKINSHLVCKYWSTSIKPFGTAKAGGQGC